MPDSEFIGLYRLNKQLVHNLIQELEPFLSSKGGLSIECKVLTALSFYASGSYQRFIGVNAHHKMHQVSVSNCIRAVTLALNNEHFRGKYIKFPQTRQERNIIKHGFRNLPQILKCSQILPPLLRNNYATCQGQSSDQATRHITFQPYVKPCEEDHDHKNMRLKRPMSPHLTIFIPTLTAMTSIFQRITGCIVTFYTVTVAGGTLFLSNGIDTYISIIQSLDLPSSIIFLLKVLIGFPFCFHYFNGIRYVLFNTGKWLTKPELFSSAKVSILCAAILSVLFAFL